MHKLDYFQQRRVKIVNFHSSLLKIVKIRRNIYDDQYTNLALILSDQCPHTTKIAVFGDETNTSFKDAKEFGGSIFKQLNDSYSYLSLCKEDLQRNTN